MLKCIWVFSMPNGQSAKRITSNYACVLMTQLEFSTKVIRLRHALLFCPWTWTECES